MHREFLAYELRMYFSFTTVFGDGHYKRMPRVTEGWHLKNTHCSMAMSAEHRSKFAAVHRQWRRLRVKNLEWDENSKQTNKQTN